MAVELGELVARDAEPLRSLLSREMKALFQFCEAHLWEDRIQIMISGGFPRRKFTVLFMKLDILCTRVM